jgi:hypothetical protein
MQKTEWYKSGPGRIIRSKLSESGWSGFEDLQD